MPPVFPVGFRKRSTTSHSDDNCNMYLFSQVCFYTSALDADEVMEMYEDLSEMVSENENDIS